MCGIVGYVGTQDSVPILLEGLRRLEYRGYDSAGVAILNGEGLKVEKTAGKIAMLEARINATHPSGPLGIAHTRWATHGVPNQINAHPHVDCHGRIAVVHNGIIENYSTLKTKLQQEGHRFTTDTDTEVIVHLVEKYYNGNLEKAVAEALRHLTGTYGIAVISVDDPGKIVGARHGSPLVVGICDSEYILASDVSAIIRHTNQVVYLDDEEMVVLTPAGIHTTTIREETIAKKVETVDWDLEMIEKAGFQHFMLKEIFEQPQSLRNTLRGRLLPDEGTARLGGLNMSAAELRAINRVVITACGTSWHAGLIGEYLIEELARIPVEVEYASEFRYRNPILEPGTVVLAISQSGETADTLAAMREAKRKGARVLGVCNAVGSTIARESDGGVYIHAGPEIGVASTKAFTSQVAALALFTLYLGRLGELSPELGTRIGARAVDHPGKDRNDPRRRGVDSGHRARLRPPQQFPLPGPGGQFPGRARRRAQAQGNLLHPRGGLSSRRDEARANRADRRQHAGGLHLHAGLCLREGPEQHGRGSRAPREDHRGGFRGRHARPHKGRPRLVHSPHHGIADAAPRGHSAPAPRLPHRGRTRVRRGSAPESREERYGRVTPDSGGSVLRTDGAPAAIGPYVQGRSGTLSGRWIVTSGQIGLDPATGNIVPGGVAAETERVIDNLEAILKSAGATLAEVTKTTVFLIGMDEFGAMNEVYARRFPDPKPARTTVAVRELPRSSRVEIEAWAFIG